LPELILSRQNDEEIIIIDSASTDGTKEFLQELHQAGKIQKFISEPDHGEAHGTNKGILLSEGDFIKIITDDDLFSFPAVETCTDFMIRNPQIDLLMGNGGKSTLFSKDISLFSYEAAFKKWLTSGSAFAFCGLGLLIRKNSLSLLGLLDSSYLIVDAEYSLRNTANKKVMAALYTGALYFHVANKNSNTNTASVRFLSELKRLEKIYGTKSEASFLKKVTARIKPKKMKSPSEAFSDIAESYSYYQQWIANEYRNNTGKFLYKK
jgi:glycosyltransferase involved in cell wall biosynthesis